MAPRKTGSPWAGRLNSSVRAHMRIFAILALLLSAFGGAYGADAPNSLVLKTGGSIFHAAFEVRLSASGQLRVHKTSTPNSDAKTINKKLSAIQAQEIFLLASRSSDFALGCGQVADGTSAGMRITYRGTEQTFSCQGSPTWPRGATTRELLSAINQHLPHDLQVF